MALFMWALQQWNVVYHHSHLQTWILIFVLGERRREEEEKPWSDGMSFLCRQFLRFKIMASDPLTWFTGSESLEIIFADSSLIVSGTFHWPAKWIWLNRLCLYACAHMLVHLHVITPPLSVIRLTCTIIISEPVVIDLLTVTWLLLDLLVNDLILTALYVILGDGWTLGPKQALKFLVSHRFMSILTFKCLLCPFYASCTHFTFKH